MSSDLLPMPSDPRWRRLLVLGVFLALLVGFRHLAPVFVCFVVLERLLGAVADAIERRTGVVRARGVAAVLGMFAAAMTFAVVTGVRAAAPLVRRVRAEGRDYIEGLSHHPAVERVRHMTGGEGGADIGASVKQHAMEAVHYATAFAHVALYLVIGLLLAVIYMFEREEIDAWFRELPAESIGGTLCRWMGYVADAIVVTVRMQAVAAVVNGVITLPVLIGLGLPHIPLLFLMIVVTGLLPVVGNFLAGAVLCVVAYEAKGAWAVGVFLAVTFVLHKIESYFLTPRLAAQHVELPGLLLVVSLLLFEHAFGFWGLFLSFPTLYVAQRIHNEWKAEVSP